MIAAGGGRMTLGLGGATSLTIGPGITISGSGNINQSAASTLDNHGTINANVSAATLTIAVGSFTNFGSAHAGGGGSLTVNAAAWSNPGAITVTAGTVNLGGTFDATGGIGTWTNSGGAVNLTGTVNNTASTLTLAANTGAWVVSGGRINNGQVDILAGGGLSFTNSTANTLDGLTVNGNLGFTAAGARAVILNSLTLNGTASFTSASGGTLTFGTGASGAQSLLGAATISMTGSLVTITNSSGAALTFGPNVLISGRGTITGASGSIINLGTIRANSTPANQSIGINAPGLVNLGLMEAAGATLSVNSLGWTSAAGTISVQGGTLNLLRTYTTADLGLANFLRTGGTVNVGGVLNNTAATLELDSSKGTWIVAGGTINGGTINTSGGAVLAFDGVATNTINGVTINGTMDLTTIGSARATVLGGLTLNGLATISTGATLFFGTNPSPPQSLLGAAIITLTGGTVHNNTGNTLSLGSGVLVQGNGTVTTTTGSISSAAAIRATTGSMTVSGSSFTNSGTLEAPTGNTLSVTATNWTGPSGTVSVQGGTVIAGGGWSTTGGSGTVELANGILRFAGTVNNTGNTFAFAPGSIGTVELAGATFTSGNFDILAGLTTSITSTATFAAGATINGDLTLPALGSSMRVSGGMTLNGTATFGGAGASLVFNGGSQVLGGNANLVMVSGGSPDEVSASAGATVTIGPGVTISGIGRLSAGNTFGGTGAFINQGVIDANVSAGTLSIQPTTFQNTGIVRATSGGILSLATNVTTADIGDLRSVGGTVNLASTINNTASTLALNATTGSYTLQAGMILGGIVSATGGAKLVIGNVTTSRLNGVTVNGDLDFTTNNFPVLQVLNGLTLNGTATMPTAAATIIFNGGTQMLDGTASIVMVLSLIHI